MTVLISMNSQVGATGLQSSTLTPPPNVDPAPFRQTASAVEENSGSKFRHPKPSPVGLAELREVFTTLLNIHKAIADLEERCAGAENAADEIQSLEMRLAAKEVELAQLSNSLRDADRRAAAYQRRCVDVETKLTSLQRVISETLKARP